MGNELKATVINMKSLSQNIEDPIVVGAGDAAGRSLRIIFTQEAAAQFTPDTKVYLSWKHQEKNIVGYNIFTEIVNEETDNFPPTWEIFYPRSMLYAGNVVACIEIVDNISIAVSTNFTIHILEDPNDGSIFTASDDFTEFQNAIIQLHNLNEDDRIVRFIGLSSIELTDGGTEIPIIDNKELDPLKKGYLVFYNSDKFIWDGSVWCKF